MKNSVDTLTKFWLVLSLATGSAIVTHGGWNARQEKTPAAGNFRFRGEQIASDFGVGYGKSSGYASADRRYAPGWRQARFQCA